MLIETIKSLTDKKKIQQKNVIKSYQLLITLDQKSIDHNFDDFTELYSFIHTAICYYRIVNNIRHLPIESPAKKSIKNNFEDIGKISSKEVSTSPSSKFPKPKKESKSPMKSNLLTVENKSMVNQSSSISLFQSKGPNLKSLGNTSISNKEDNQTLNKICSEDGFSPSSVKIKKIATRNPIELVLNIKKSYIKHLNSSFSHGIHGGSKTSSNKSTSFMPLLKSSPVRDHSAKSDSNEISQSILHMCMPLFLNDNNNIINNNKSPLSSPKIKINLNDLKNRNQYSNRLTSPISAERNKSHINLGKREIQTERQKSKQKITKIPKLLLTMIKTNEPIMESIEELSHREKNENNEIDTRNQTNDLIFEPQIVILIFITEN